MSNHASRGALYVALTAGLLLALLALARLRPAVDEDAAQPTQPAARGNQEQEERISALERRLAATSGQMPLSPTPIPSAHPTVSRSATIRPSNLDQADAEARTRKEFATLNARLNSEGSDPEWSPAAMTTFSGDLLATSTRGGFDIVSLDCRTTMCAATLQWATYADALSNYTRVLHSSYRENCAVALHVPEPEARGAKYQAKVYFDCEQSRSGEVDRFAKH